MKWMPQAAREQAALDSEPYDRWVSPQGICMAEFHRRGQAFLLRFPHQADFLIEESSEGFTIVGWPTPGCDGATLSNLYHNAIQPILGNHLGGLFLHGSAVRVSTEEQDGGNAGVIAFLGLSRGGKTTLAGSFAREGHPFLTEDVIDLRPSNGLYWLQPKRSKLRLFSDSARFLLGGDIVFSDEDMKQDVEADERLPFAQEPAPLRQIYLLGNDHAAALSIRRLSLQEALSALMPHSFILDVTDKKRLREHFTRLADLSQDIPCFALDFTRDYAELPPVRAAVLENFASTMRQLKWG
jgi:hypothetical protein